MKNKWKHYSKKTGQRFCAFFLGCNKIILLKKRADHWGITVWGKDGLANCYLREPSLEVAKFKALVRARELGWDVNIIGEEK